MAQTLDWATVAKAILDLADLAMRHLTVDQRGRTSLASKDDEVLGAIVSKLVRHRQAHIAPELGEGEHPELTPDMRALGWIRRAFNDLCLYAAKRRQSVERDRRLAEHLLLPFQSTRFQVTRDQVFKAMEAVRKTAYGPRNEKYAEARLDIDWLKGARPSDEWYSVTGAAGELLREIMEACELTVDASLSYQSTALYAQRVFDEQRALRVRRVTALERLTYIATVLGVTLDEAPWVAFQVSKLLAGEQLLGRQAVDGFSLELRDPHPPEPFRLLDKEHKSRIAEIMRQRLFDAGVPRSKVVESVRPFDPALEADLKWKIAAALYKQFPSVLESNIVSTMTDVEQQTLPMEIDLVQLNVDLLISEPTTWAGKDVGQVEETPMWPNPWGDEQTE